ncbi:MAG: hypothetical protein ABSG01_10045 [Anaerolineales bacterium]|jgi:hypothetical protein
MKEENESLPPKIHLPSNPDNLRAKYNALLAYINAVVTFRFTTLGFFLAATALILGVKPSFEKYSILFLITFSLYIIELRNRFLKNELAAMSRQIEKKWGYIVNKKPDYELDPTTIFGIVINKGDISENDKLEYNFGKWLGFKFTHSLALDILYILILIYAFINTILQLIPKK